MTHNIKAIKDRGTNAGKNNLTNDFVNKVTQYNPFFAAMQEVCSNQAFHAGIALNNLGYNTWHVVAKQAQDNCGSNGVGPGSYGNTLHISRDSPHLVDTTKHPFQSNAVYTASTTVFSNQHNGLLERKRVDCGGVSTTRGNFRVCTAHLTAHSPGNENQFNELNGLSLMTAPSMFAGDFNLEGYIPSAAPTWRRDSLQVGGQYPPTFEYPALVACPTVNWLLFCFTDHKKLDWVLGRSDSTFVRNNNADSLLIAPTMGSDHMIVLAFLRN